MNVPFSGYPRHSDGDTIEIDNQSRQSSPLHPTACAPTNTCTAFPTQPTQPSSGKPWNRANLASFPLFRRIRRVLASTRDRVPLTQRAVWIAPAQFVEQVVVAPTRDRSRATNPSTSPGEDIPLPDDGQSTITTSEDEGKGCCSFCGWFSSLRALMFPISTPCVQ
ncbi:hypothetical protein EDD16DRAFT_615028 [Pisolithus croceorrhizus]|nr:hypothetical protein EDD16DRAFT_615028 [Pisolithus croceorrhizus]